MDYEDQLVLSGELNDVGAPLRTTSGSSYRLGLEIDAEVLLSEKLSIRPNLGLSTNKKGKFHSSKIKFVRIKGAVILLINLLNPTA